TTPPYGGGRSMDEASPLLLTVEEGLATLTLNRPAALNALSRRLATALVDALRELAARPDLRAVVLRGAGERAFCTGADLKERAGMTDRVWHAQHRVFEAAFRSILECRHPVIAAVEGYALAGGLERALYSDGIIAASGAAFAQ